MVRTESNKDLITEIQAGIKKEFSTGIRPKKLICSICGSDNMKTYCPHWPGETYEKESGPTTCMMTIDGAAEAYELSLVAVPAQPRAGTVKNYGPKPPEEPEVKEAAAPEEPMEQPAEEASKDLETSLRARALESFIFTQNT